MTEAKPGNDTRRPVILCILDGWGWRTEREANAVLLAETPNFDRLWAGAPHALLQTDGPAVGLPEGQFGNSEVGHLNLGAGRVVMQELPRIDAALRDGSLARSPTLREFVERARGGSGRAHLLGLLSPGGVHSHQNHLLAMAELLAQAGLQVLVHAFTDGRDTAPRGGQGYLAEVGRAIGDQPDLRAATITGRYFAMDRDKRWERTERAYRAIVAADAPRAGTWQEAIARSYAEGIGDEFVEPRVIGDYDGMHPGDAVLCINFRADRVRQIMTALVEPGFTGFERGPAPGLSVAAGMTSYSAELDRHLLVLFPPQTLPKILGEVVANAGLKQLRLAETEKYPHVTFFFNGGEETPYPGEERVLVPSPKVATYDLQPEMSAVPLTDKLVEAVRSRRFDFILINYANPDMVGHTGKLEAAITAVETVDGCLGRLVEALDEVGGTALVTADHGNCELMVDPETGGPHTAHTLSPVPVMLIGGPPGARLRGGRLADVAPTVLALLGEPQPAEMTGTSLLAASSP